jgi:hypothetical protein
MKTEEERGASLNKAEEEEVVGVEEIDMVRCFKVTTKAGLEYLAHYIPPFDKPYIKVTYEYIGGEVDELFGHDVKKAVLKYIGAEEKQKDENEKV